MTTKFRDILIKSFIFAIVPIIIIYIPNFFCQINSNYYHCKFMYPIDTFFSSIVSLLIVSFLINIQLPVLSKKQLKKWILHLFGLLLLYFVIGSLILPEFFVNIGNNLTNNELGFFLPLTIILLILFYRVLSYYDDFNDLFKLKSKNPNYKKEEINEFKNTFEIRTYPNLKFLREFFLEIILTSIFISGFIFNSTFAVNLKTRIATLFSMFIFAFFAIAIELLFWIVYKQNRQNILNFVDKILKNIPNKPI
ncbi:MAG: hypothetical protein V1859_00710 [archaeon]